MLLLPSFPCPCAQWQRGGRPSANSGATRQRPLVYVGDKPAGETVTLPDMAKAAIRSNPPSSGPFRPSRGEQKKETMLMRTARIAMSQIAIRAIWATARQAFPPTPSPATHPHMSPQVGTLTHCPEIRSKLQASTSILLEPGERSERRTKRMNVAVLPQATLQNISNSRSRPALLLRKDLIVLFCLRRIQSPQGDKQCQRARNCGSDHLKKTSARPLSLLHTRREGEKRCSKVIDERITIEAVVAQQVVGVTSRVRLSTAYSCASVNITS